MGNNYKTKLNHLNILQKRGIRLISKAGYRDHTGPLFLKLKLLKLPELIKLKTAKIAFKAFQNNLPVNIQNRYVQTNNIYGTRQMSNLNFKKCYSRTTQKSLCPIIRSINIWNNCDKHLKISKSIFAFKKLFKNSLLMSYNA
jgi:hypothetical protein